MRVSISHAVLALALTACATSPRATSGTPPERARGTPPDSASPAPRDTTQPPRAARAAIAPVARIPHVAGAE